MQGYKFRRHLPDQNHHIVTNYKQQEELMSVKIRFMKRTAG